MLFDTKERDARLTGGVLSWEMSNPRFQQLLDTLSRAVFNRSFHMLSGEGLRSAMTFMAMAAQNSIPGLGGNPVDDFVAVNRALISGGIPLMSGENGSYKGTAFGTGNVTTAITTQLLKGMEESFSNPDGSVDLGQTYGLSQSQRAQLLAKVIARRGVKEGDILNYDLSNATSSESLNRAISSMEGKVNESELKDLRKISGALKVIEDNDFTDKKDYEISDFLENKGYDTSTIQKTIAQLRGKNSSVNMITKRMQEEVHDLCGELAENVKDLSNLFQTEDLDKIEQYAKGMGMGDVLSKENANKVRAQMREIDAIATYTGRSPQEIAAERVQISMGLSAAMGGRVADSNLVNTISNAGIAPGRNGNDGLFTKEEAQTAATRSVLNAQNVYKGMLQANEAMRQLGDSADPETRAEYERLKKEREEAGTDREKLEDVNRRMAEFAYKHFGDTVNSEAFLKSAASHDKESVDIHKRMIASENVSTIVNDWANRKGASEDESAAMKDVGTFLVEAFGNDDVARSKFLSDIKNKNDKEVATKFAAMGYTEEEASKILADINKAGGAGQVAEAMTGLNAEWMQQFTGKSEETEIRRLETVKLMGEESQNLSNSASYSSTMRSIIPGLLTDKGVDVTTAADIAVADAVRKDANGNALNKKLNDEFVNGTDSSGKANSLSMGEVNTKNNTLEFNGEDGAAKKQKLINALGLSEEEFDELNRTKGVTAIVELAEQKGYMFSHSKNGNDNVLVSKEYAENKRQFLMDQANKAGIGDAAKILGSDAIVAASDENGASGYKIAYKGKRFDTNKEVVQEMIKNKDFTKLLAASSVSQEARHAASDQMKSALAGIENEMTVGNEGKILDDDTIKLLNKLGGRRTDKDGNVINEGAQDMSLDDYKTILENAFGTVNTKALDSGYNAVAEGLAEHAKGQPGKYILLHDVGSRKAGSKVEEEDLLEEAKKLKKYGALYEKMNAEAHKDKPPTYAQMDEFLRMYKANANR